MIFYSLGPLASRPSGLGQARLVIEVLESWTHPGCPESTYRKPVISPRHGLLVLSPMPGEPGRDGEFVMVATEYGDRDCWWIRPDDRPAFREMHRPVPS